MRAILLHGTSGPDAVTVGEATRPEPARDEYRIRVHAAGINPLDWLISEGMITHALDTDLPWIPGWDVSGVVESAGPDVTEFAPGDPVVGMARLPGAGGTFAEYVTLSDDEVAAKPATLTHREASAVPMAGQTAFHALHEEGAISSGDRVLVHAAAGGVGHMAVQFAKSSGAHVIGTASGRNEQFLNRIGVDEFVNYREEQFEDVLDDVDFVLDAIGGDVLERSVELLQPGGVVVTLPEPPGETAVERYSTQYGVDVRFFDVITDTEPATLRQVASHVDTGALRPVISDQYPLSAAREALARISEGHTRGKIVFDLSEEPTD